MLRARVVRVHAIAVAIGMPALAFVTASGLWLVAVSLLVGALTYPFIARVGLRQELNHMLAHELSAFADTDSDPLRSLQSPRSDYEEGVS